MNKIKIISGHGGIDLQDKIDEWIQKDNPKIVSTSLSKDGSLLVISITYNEAPDVEALLS